MTRPAILFVTCCFLFLSVCKADDGDAQLARAFDHAFSMIATELESLLAKARLPFLRTNECLNQLTEFPKSPEGAFQSVLKDEKIIFGYLRNDIFAPQFKTIVAMAVDKISKNYEKNISPVFFSETNPILLQNSFHERGVSASLPSVDSSPYYAESIRFSKFMPSCAICAFPSMFYASKKSTFVDFAHFQSSVIKNNELKIAVESNAVYLFSILHPDLMNSIVEINEIPEKLESSFIQINKGVVAVYCTRVITNPNDFVIISSDILTPVRMFFRVAREETAFPFAETFSKHLFGNTQIRTAYDVVISDYQTNPTNLYKDIYQIPNFSVYKDCSDVLERPDKTQLSVYKRAVENGKFRVGYLNNLGPPLLELHKNGTLSGVLPALMEQISLGTGIIFNIYHVLPVTSKIYTSTKAAFDGLENDEVEVIAGMYVGAQTLRRYNFETTCSIGAIRPRLWYKTSNYREKMSLIDIRDLTEGATSKYIVVLDDLARSICLDLFPSAEVVFVESIEHGFERLSNDSNALAFIGNYVETPPSSEFTNIQSDLSIPLTIFFRRDKETFFTAVKRNFWWVALIVVGFAIVIGLIVVLVLCLRKNAERKKAKLAKDGDFSVSLLEEKDTKKKSQKGKRIEEPVHRPTDYVPPDVVF